MLGLRRGYKGLQPMSFADELEIVRKEANAAAQFLYASLAPNALAAEHTKVLARLNDAPLFWNTTIFALQKSAIVALGRIFQTNTPHNVARLPALAEDVSILSKDALAQRKQGTSPMRPEWIDAYLVNKYEPTPADIRVLKKQVGEWSAAYVARYKPLRDKGYAHREFSTETEAWQNLIGSTQIEELERMCTFLIALHDALWVNGLKPDVQERETKQRDLMENLRAAPSTPVARAERRFEAARQPARASAAARLSKNFFDCQTGDLRPRAVASLQSRRALWRGKAPDCAARRQPRLEAPPRR